MVRGSLSLSLSCTRKILAKTVESAPFMWKVLRKTTQSWHNQRIEVKGYLSLLEASPEVLHFTISIFKVIMINQYHDAVYMTELRGLEQDLPDEEKPRRPK